jgi:glutathione S-transferase
MRLYLRDDAGRPIRVVWALEEVGARYQIERLSSEEGAGAEHRARHPLGRVPVLETDDATLFESTALCLHVAELYPAAGLIPASGTSERALVYQWLFFAMTELEPRMIDTYRLRPSAPALADAAGERCAAALDAVEQTLAGREYLLGESFSVADIVVGEVVRVVSALGAAERGPNAKAYVARLRRRPARRRAAELAFERTSPPVLVGEPHKAR